MLAQEEELLAQANLPVINLELWKEAIKLSDLGKIIRPDYDNSPHNIYQTLLKFEAHRAEEEKRWPQLKRPGTS